MREALKLEPLCTSSLCSAALLGAVLALIAILPPVANAQEDPTTQVVTICHRPGTPAEQTITIPSSALDRHQGHGDTSGPCYGEEATCPCAAYTGHATFLNRTFLRQEFVGEPTTVICFDDGVVTDVFRWDSAVPSYDSPTLFRTLVYDIPDEPGFPQPTICLYQIRWSNGDEAESWHQLQPGEDEACREDIRKLIAKLDDCPTP